jgi:hypothetical protein
MMQGPWETVSHSASEEIPAFCGTQSSLQCSQEPTNGRYPEPIQGPV